MIIRRQQRRSCNTSPLNRGAVGRIKAKLTDIAWAWVTSCLPSLQPSRLLLLGPAHNVLQDLLVDLIVMSVHKVR